MFVFVVLQMLEVMLSVFSKENRLLAIDWFGLDCSVAISGNMIGREIQLVTKKSGRCLVRLTVLLFG